jgi:hypothetical protein
LLRKGKGRRTTTSQLLVNGWLTKILTAAKLNLNLTEVKYNLLPNNMLSATDTKAKLMKKPK